MINLNDTQRIFNSMPCGTTVNIKASLESMQKQLAKKESYMSVKYNKSSIMKRAYWLLNNEYGVNTFSEALKQSWAESKKVILENRKDLNRLQNAIVNYTKALRECFC
jgi:hypothetical protein